MNNKGQLGLAFALVFIIVALTTFALISPLTTVLDDVRSGNSTLNCPGAPDFNQTLYDLDDTSDKLRKRPVCFITGMYMIYFVFAVLIFGIIWAYKKWRTT